MPTVDLISLDHAAAQEQISTEQAEELARGNRQFIGLFVVVTALVLFVVF